MPLRFMIVIPVYNHARTLRAVVARALEVHGAVMVVDDGSTDEGSRTLEGLPARLVRHEVNQGKGAAILTAAREARRLGMTHIITMDADGQHDPADVARLVAVMQAEPQAVVIGTRTFPSQGIPALTRFGRSFSNFWVRLQTGVAVGDSQSGYRAYPLEVLERLRLHEKRYAFEVEVLVKAAWAGVRLCGTAIPVYYPPPAERVSHFRVFVDNLRISLLNTGLTLRSMLPFPHRKVFEPGASPSSISVLHPVRSLRLLLRQQATPLDLSLSAAVGVSLGAMPLFFFHSLSILGVTGYFRLNKIAALAASQLCMPPLVPAICIEAGYFLRHGQLLTEISFETLGYQALERIWEWLLGSLLMAPVMGLAMGALVYALAAALRWTIREIPAPKD